MIYNIIFVLLFLCFEWTHSNPNNDFKPVSIIVYSFQQSSIYTVNCLRSIERLIQLENNANLIEKVIVVEIGARQHVYHRHVERFVEDLNERDDASRFSLLPFAVGNSSQLELSPSLNRAVELVESEFVLFLHDSVELLADRWQLSVWLRRFKMSTIYGALTAPILLPDRQTVHDIGVEYALESNDEAPVNWWDTPSEDGKNIPLPHDRWRGISIDDERVREQALWSSVNATSLALMFVKRQTFASVDGLSSAFTSMRYAAADLCVRLEQRLTATHQLYRHPLAIRYPDSLIETDKNLYSKDKKAFERHMKHLEPKLRASFLLPRDQLLWNMECGLGQVLGFTSEALGFVVALERLLDTRIEVSVQDEECLKSLRDAGIEPYIGDAVARMLGKKRDNKARRQYLVVHRDPGRYDMFTTSLADDTTCVIGRSMYETSKIPDNWVRPCNERVHQVWVPTEFNVDTFVDAGVKRDQLLVVNEPLDIHRFDALKFAADEHDDSDEPTEQRGHSEPLELHDLAQLRPLHALTRAEKSNFRFLSVGKWEERKGWRDLLQAYFDAFSNEDNVSLWLRVSLHNENVEAYEKIIEEYCKEHDVERSALPQVVVIESLIAYDQLPALYRAANVYVTTAHGEGWGLPLVESMACGLPVIGLNYSGPATVLAGTDATIVAHKMVSVPEGASDEKWAQIERDELAAALVDTYGAGAAAARQRGMHARSVVRERFAAAAVARRVTAQLESMACEKLAAFGSVGSANFDDAWRRASDWRSQSSPVGPSKVKIQIND